jgi:hypothetical protein
MPKKPSRSVRRYLSAREAVHARAALHAGAAKLLVGHGVHGWGLVGTRDKLRFAVEVPRLVANPEAPITAVSLPKKAGGGALKPTVRASFVRSGPTFHFLDAVAGAPDGAVSEALAPGSSIIVDSRPRQAAGVSCMVRCDGDAYLVTCGHVFEEGARKTNVHVGRRVVATLTHNFLDDDKQEDEQLDAAYCKLTPDGERLLHASSDAPSWSASIHEPGAEDLERSATFYPARSATAALAGKVLSTSFCQTDLWNRFWSLSLCHLIQLPPLSDPGDSGSPLLLDGALYGLCTGAVGVHSYFTPLFAVAERLKRQFSEVLPWTPDDT